MSKELTIAHAVRHTASNAANFKYWQAAMTVPYQHEVSLNPDQIERDIWIAAQSYQGGVFALKSTLRFYLEAEVVAEIPNSRGNTALAGEQLLIGLHSYRLDPTYYPTSTGPVCGRQPCLSLHRADAPDFAILVPSFFLRVRATRAVLTLERGSAAGPAVSGLAVLSVGADAPELFGAARAAGGGALGLLTPRNLALGGAVILGAVYFLRKR